MASVQIGSNVPEQPKRSGAGFVMPTWTYPRKRGVCTLLPRLRLNAGVGGFSPSGQRTQEIHQVLTIRYCYPIPVLVPPLSARERLMFKKKTLRGPK